MWYRFFIKVSIFVLCIVITGCGFYSPLNNKKKIQLQIAPIPEHDGMIFREALEDAMNGYFSSSWKRIVLLRTSLKIPTANITNEVGATAYTTINIEANFDLVPENFNGKITHLKLSYICGALGGKSLYTSWQEVDSMREKCLRAFAYRAHYRIIELLNESQF